MPYELFKKAAASENILMKKHPNAREHRFSKRQVFFLLSLKVFIPIFACLYHVAPTMLYVRY